MRLCYDTKIDPFPARGYKLKQEVESNSPIPLDSEMSFKNLQQTCEPIVQPISSVKPEKHVPLPAPEMSTTKNFLLQESTKAKYKGRSLVKKDLKNKKHKEHLQWLDRNGSQGFDSDDEI